jgi:hypothetical protein
MVLSFGGSSEHKLSQATLVAVDDSYAYLGLPLPARTGPWCPTAGAGQLDGVVRGTRSTCQPLNSATSLIWRAMPSRAWFARSWWPSGTGVRT